MVGFGRVLREAGLEVGPGRLQDALRGLDVVGLTRREDVYHTLRCTLVARREEIDAFDAAFADYWERAPRTPAPEIGLEVQRLDPSAAPAATGREADGGGGDDGDETDDAARLLARRAPAPARLRRHDGVRAAPAAAADGAAARRAPRRGARAGCGPGRAATCYDARRTLRRAMRTQGLPLDPAFREPQAGAAQARVPVRRVRLDGAVRAGDGDVHAGRDRRRPPGGGVRVRHPDHAAHAAPAHARPGALARAGRRADARLGRRHPHRRVAARLQRDVGAARADARGGRRDRLGRVGARRPGPARPPSSAASPARRTGWCG